MNVGQHVLFRHDALVEVARSVPGPPTWRFLPAGTRGKLLGWRDREPLAGEAGAIVEVDGTDRRLVVILAEAKLSGAEAIRPLAPPRRRARSRRGSRGSSGQIE